MQQRALLKPVAAIFMACRFEAGLNVSVSKGPAGFEVTHYDHA